MSERVAILVIHGMGQQRPYETLDQFSRNLLTSFCRCNPLWTAQLDLDSQPDPIRIDKSWIRASYILRPPAGVPIYFASDKATQIEDISLFEYYWAPITQDKITYRGSLAFLIRAGAKPFVYMASNISILWATQKKRIWRVVLKELWRQACLFTPLLLLFAFLLWWLQPQTAAAFLKLAKDPVLVACVIALSLRYLNLYTGVTALWQSLHAKTGWQCATAWRTFLVLWIGAHLFAWPLLFAGLISFIENHLPFATHLERIHGFLAAGAKATTFPFQGSWPSKITSFLLLNCGLKEYLLPAFSLLVAYLVRYILVDYVGDVAVYVNASEFAKTYAARVQILDECSSVLTGLLTEKYASGPKQGQPLYDRVLIAAHSLGTVIGYDTLNVLLNTARTSDPANPASLQPRDLENLRGLLTFGSPLNKIFYFFRELGDPKLAMRQQTLDLLHGFRLKNELSAGPFDPEFLPNPDPRWQHASDALAAGFRWINAYSLADPISGRIAFYDLQAQERFEYPWPFLAHLAYWEDSRLYDFFRANLL